MSEERRIDLFWSKPATLFLRADQPYVDLEGAFRSQKSTALCRRILKYALDYPGICCALARWTDDTLEAMLRPKWREVCGWFGVSPKWHAGEQYYEFPGIDSKVYMRALKAAEDTGRYSKYAGLTLSVLGIDQAEEVPEDVYRAYVPARLSQPGYPHQVLLTPNPPDYQHWLTREFPEDNREKHKLYLHTSMYDNRRILGDEYIAAQEKAYPPGTAQHRTFVLGLRGLGVKGDPVYKGQFIRRLHVNDTLEPDPALEVYEAWDWGHGHPCVVWAQYPPMGGMKILGGLQGQDMLIYQFAPKVLEYRQRWFPPSVLFRSTADPAGYAQSSQGTAQSVWDIMRDEFGVNLLHQPDANKIEQRNAAIQRIGGFMKLMTSDGPAFEIHPRFVLVLADGSEEERPILVDGLEAGYVWDSRSIISTNSPNTRRPKKDGMYDHSQNCLEYITLAFAPAGAMALSGVAYSPEQLRLMQRKQRAAEQRALRLAQHDVDEDDPLWRKSAAWQRSGRKTWERGGFAGPRGGA